MISGPTIPNTLGSLRDLVVQQVDLIEHGLRVLSEDLVLGEHALVDVLACDANGAPVLVFVASPESAPGLASRVLDAQGWMRKNGNWLAQELGDHDLRADLPSRVLVIGLEVLVDTLAELRRLRVEHLTVLQFCSFTLGGRLRLGVTPMFEQSGVVGDAAPSSPDDRPTRGIGELGAAEDCRPRAEPAPFGVPAGIEADEARTLCSRFLDLVRRVDCRMTATGDRFSRRFFLGGRVVAELGMRAGRPQVSVRAADPYEHPETLELTESTCLTIVDRILRRVLATGTRAGNGAAVPSTVDLPSADGSRQRDVAAVQIHDPGSDEPESPTANEVTADLPPASPTTSPPGTLGQTGIAPGQDQDRFSLEPIRRSVARAQLSREEFSALGSEGSDT